MPSHSMWMLSLDPLLTISGQSMDEINNEIMFVSKMLVSPAINYLPMFSNKVKKNKIQFNSPKLTELSNNSMNTWRIWNASGRPIAGPVYI